MALPFESDSPTSQAPLLTPDVEDVISLLLRAARDLDRLECSPTRNGGDALRLSAASRAVHVALVELSPLS